ncbi:hypothetical protein [Porticoccus sp.]
MYDNPLSSAMFHVRSPVEAEFLKPLVNCRQDALFTREAVVAPMALNLFFPAVPDPDYADLINREISLYAERFHHRRVTKIWFRGAPLAGMKAGELTELAFHTNLLFSSELGGSGEYGFECKTGDINSDNLALMKGLRFNRILLCIDAAMPPGKQPISQQLDLIDEYRFQEVRYRLSVSDADPDTLRCWLTALLHHKPDMLEIQGLNEMDGAVPLGTVARQMMENQYHLLGDRFFVPPDHPLMALREQDNVQYTPWGLCRRQLNDWLGVGLGALGKLGRGYYQNTDQLDRYRQQVSASQLPVCCSGAYPDRQQKPHPWQLVEQLLCLHRVSLPSAAAGLQLSRAIQAVLDEAADKGWLARTDGCLILTATGLDHIHTLCQQLQQC